MLNVTVRVPDPIPFVTEATAPCTYAGTEVPDGFNAAMTANRFDEAVAVIVALYDVAVGAAWSNVTIASDGAVLATPTSRLVQPAGKRLLTRIETGPAPTFSTAMFHVELGGDGSVRETALAELKLISFPLSPNAAV